MTGAGRIVVDVLGPLRVRSPQGDDLTPAGVLQRRLLALLVLRRGEVVTVDAAADALWPSAPPRDAVAALQNHVSRLRRALPPGALEAVGPGYRLDPAPLDVDVERLRRRLSEEALTGDGAAEVQLLLERWNGPAYPELDDLDAGRIEATRLEELRVLAAEAVAASRLQSGTVDGLVAELGALVERVPLRERPRSLLMSALAASGRTAEALRVYDDFRRLLGDELGISPSPALDAQHAALLVTGAPAAERPVSAAPLPATPILGRDALIADLLDRVADARVLTLVGPGGVGKTRVLVEIAARVRVSDPELSVVFSDLTQADPATAVEHAATSLGIDVRLGTSTAERIARVLGESEVLLLLDNCEHVLDAVAALVDALCRSCPRVRVLATSRERLRVAGEQVCPVPPLPTGDGEAAAVDLFLARARSVQPGFEPDDEARACIVSIVRRLDGLPLAIELAAARLHTHDLTEIAAGLDRPLGLLSTGYRTSARHSSLEAVVSWSYAMLDDPLRQGFASLSVFSTPFTSRAAAAICGLEVPPAERLLAELVERSLVMRVPGRRYRMLETLRAFGAEQRAGPSGADPAAARHAAWHLEWAIDIQRRLAVPGEPVLTEVDESLPDLRVALAWLLDHDQVDAAGRLVAGLVTYALLRLRPDVLVWAEAVIAADPEGRATCVSELWAAASFAAWMAGDVAECGARSIRAVELAERRGAMTSLVATTRGDFDLFEGRLDEAARWYRQGVAVAVDAVDRVIAAGAEVLALGYAGDPAAAAAADALLHDAAQVGEAPAAYAWYCAGEAELARDVVVARDRLQRAVELSEQANASFVRGVAGASKASIDARVGDPELAAADYRWLISHWQRAGMWSTQWTMLRSIVGLLARLGCHRDAAILEAAVRATDAGHRIFGADEIALQATGARLRAALGDEAYEEAKRIGALLDGQAAVEHALRALR